MWLPWSKKKVHHNRTSSFTSTLDSILSPYHHKHSVSLTYPLPFPPSSPIHCHSPSLKDLSTLILSPDPKSKPSSSIFLRVKSWAAAHPKKPTTTLPPPPNSSNRVVIYYTSLRVIRKTFDDSRAVRSILKSYKVRIDERDVSMDASFLDELQGITAKKEKAVPLGEILPRVYVDGVFIGGAEEIRRLHESGEMKRLIQGLPGDDGSGKGVCEVCGGFGFVLCEHCDGSHRVFVDTQVGFKSCGKCNVNGLVRCHNCISVVF